MKVKGTISHFDPRRSFGFIESRDQNGWVLRFFFVARSIIRSEVEEPRTGLKVLFEVSPIKPSEGKLPSALDIEVLAPKSVDLEAPLKNPLGSYSLKPPADMHPSPLSEPEGGAK